ncbi:MAG TPA: dinitrogenase iron-molybdenum cofactor [Firmicutes bacterium]|jgi:predicted Fe-Mo cluster-binding NifX family protein|nr:dinitrogenase iron-molybdenum cofactor [Bacillota bacterium]
MKIAIPADNGQVAAHFGHCAQFVLAEVADGHVVEMLTIDNPGHRPGFLPRFLAEQGATVLIAGGIGSSAVQIFNELGIEVFMGAQGKVEEAVEQYLKGELRSSGSACPEHQH